MKLFTAWMEVLANVGVLVGIIFLTIEVSQNTLAAKSEASLAIQTSIAESLSKSVSTPEMFDVVYKVYTDEELTRKEWLLAAFLWHSILTLMDGAIVQYDLGIIDSNILELFDDELYLTAQGTDFSKQYWQTNGPSFSPQLQAYVEKLIEKKRAGSS